VSVRVPSSGPTGWGPRWLPIETLLQWLSPAVLLVAWELAVDRGWLDHNFFPSPSSMIAAAWQDIRSGDMLRNSLGSLERLAWGLLIGSLFGIVVGLAMALWRPVEAVLNMPVQVVRAIPPIAWIGFAILWFGLGTKPAVFLIALGVAFPILLNTYAGVRQTDLIYMRAAAMLGARGLLLFKDVIFAAALPNILTGLRISVGIAWVLVVVGELVGAPNGLGAALMRAQDYQQTDRMLAYMLAIGLYGFLSDALVVRASRYLLRWQRTMDDR
jgi:ABC-type nitrate/sulfonate/bicarbonate transport system permease component